MFQLQERFYLYKIEKTLKKKIFADGLKMIYGTTN